MTSAAAAAGSVRVIHVWDLPTRLFHWGLVGLVATAWLTGEGEGGAAAIHRYSGEAIAGLIVFRVVWGFVGGEHARFSDFAAGPSAIVAHMRDLFSRAPAARHLGHNPLGGVAVFLLLLNVAALVVTGLFSGGEKSAGPFAGIWGLQLSELHEILFRVLQGLTVAHIAGVAIESWKSKDAIVPALITGSKRRRPDEPGGDARRASLLALLAAVGLGIVLTATLMSAPPSSVRSTSIEAEHRSAD